MKCCDNCNQGRRECPCPDACQMAEDIKLPAWLERMSEGGWILMPYILSAIFMIWMLVEAFSAIKDAMP